MNPIESTSLEDWNRVLGINLGSVFLTSRAAIPHMRARGGGSIINLSSVAGTRSLVDAHTYVAGKGAVNSLTRGMAQTYAADGIRTNTVAPGFIDTPMVASVIGAFDDPVVAGLLCPMGRPAQRRGDRRLLPVLRVRRLVVLQRSVPRGRRRDDGKDVRTAAGSGRLNLPPNRQRPGRPGTAG